MNILYLGAFRLPNLDAAAPRVLSIARAMVMNGHTVSFLSWGGAYRESDLCVDGKYRIDGMEYVITGEIDAKGSLWTRWKAKKNRGNVTMRLLAGMAQQPDVIIMYNSAGDFTRRLLDYCNQKGVYLAHDITEWYSNRELRVTDIIPNWINMTRIQHFVPNKILISSFLDNYYPESHNIVIPATCDSRESKWSLIAEDYQFNGITFIYAGTPTMKDKLHTAINVVQRIIEEGYQLRFIILGVTREDYIARYGSQLVHTELSENIVFMGRVSQDVVPQYYTQSDFMILLRDCIRKSNAGFPTKFAESMMSGTPVLANITSDLGSYLKSGYNGMVVEAPTYEGLYHTIHDKILTLSRESIEQMKINAKKTGLEYFDYTQYSDKIQQFLLNLR